MHLFSPLRLKILLVAIFFIIHQLLLAQPAPTVAPTVAIGFTPFRVWLGTNLDFLDGIGVDKLYAQINYAALFGEGSLCKGDGKARWLTSFSFFQNKVLRNDSTDLDFSQQQLRYPSRPPIN